MNSKGVIALSIGALIATSTAIAHLSCIFIGPSCYKAQLAPPYIIRSAIEGTLVAPIGTAVVSSLFLACALFAVSGAGLIKRLPLLKLALVTISVLCILRGLVTIPSSFFFPAMASTYSLVAGIVWFVAGCLYLYGYRCVSQVSP